LLVIRFTNQDHLTTVEPVNRKIHWGSVGIGCTAGGQLIPAFKADDLPVVVAAGASATDRTDSQHSRSLRPELGRDSSSILPRNKRSHGLWLSAFCVYAGDEARTVYAADRKEVECKWTVLERPLCSWLRVWRSAW
jgi:hypothetical protein